MDQWWHAFGTAVPVDDDAFMWVGVYLGPTSIGADDERMADLRKRGLPWPFEGVDGPVLTYVTSFDHPPTPEEKDALENDLEP